MPPAQCSAPLRSDGDVDEGPPPGSDRRVVEASRLPGIRHHDGEGGRPGVGGRHGGGVRAALSTAARAAGDEGIPAAPDTPGSRHSSVSCGGPMRSGPWHAWWTSAGRSSWCPSPRWRHWQNSTRRSRSGAEPTRSGNAGARTAPSNTDGDRRSRSSASPAVHDRLTHRCHILEAKGEGFQLRDAGRRYRRATTAS